MDTKEKVILAGGAVGALLLGAYLATRTKAVSSPPPTTVSITTPSTVYTPPTTPSTSIPTTPSTVVVTPPYTPPTTCCTPPSTPSTSTPSTSTPSTSTPSTSTPSTSTTTVTFLTVTFVNDTSYSVTITNYATFNTGLAPGQSATYSIPPGKYTVIFPPLGIEYTIDVTKSGTYTITVPTTGYTATPTINLSNPYIASNGEPVSFIKVVNPYNQWVTLTYYTNAWLQFSDNNSNPYALNKWTAGFPPFLVYPVPPNYQIYIPYIGPGQIQYRGFNRPNQTPISVSVSSATTVTLQQVEDFDTPTAFGLIINNTTNTAGYGNWVQAGGYYGGDQFYMWMPYKSSVVVPWPSSIVFVQGYLPGTASGGENSWTTPIAPMCPNNGNVFGCYNPPNFVWFVSPSTEPDFLPSYVVGQVSYSSIYSSISGIQAPCGVYQYLYQYNPSSVEDTCCKANTCKASSVSPPNLTQNWCYIPSAPTTNATTSTTSTKTPSTTYATTTYKLPTTYTTKYAISPISVATVSLKTPTPTTSYIIPTPTPTPTPTPISTTTYRIGIKPIIAVI